MSGSDLQVVHVVAAVIRDGSSVLACRRRPDRSAGGKWEFPGGKVEVGESSAEALMREIREELDVEVILEKHLTTDNTIVGDRVIRLECWTAHLPGGRPTGSIDHDRLHWLDPFELVSLDWAAPDLPAVRLLTSRG